MVMPSRSLNHSRATYLCAYDIADDKRRTRLFNLLTDHGERVQYSVFLCELNLKERASIIHFASDILHHDEDQLLIIRVGSAQTDWQNKLACIGKIWTPEVRATII